MAGGSSFARAAAMAAIAHPAQTALARANEICLILIPSEFAGLPKIYRAAGGAGGSTAPRIGHIDARRARLDAASRLTRRCHSRSNAFDEALCGAA
ncbi:MAG: hypothetical protein Tsb0010_10190 [Parvularculaceae bacterium]